MTQTDQLREYIEEITLALEPLGVPRTAGHVLAYLLVCEPPEQSMNDLVEALQMSKSSVSTATQTLIQFRMIVRFSVPGERRDYYRMERDIWEKIMTARVAEMSRLRELAAKGLQMLDDEDTQTPERLQEMYHTAKFMEEEIPRLLARWNARKNLDKYQDE